MADICVDGTLTTGTEAGTVAGATPTDVEWANAIHTEATIQTAIDGLAAGDTMHITRTLTLTATLDIDIASGAVGNYIFAIGYNYNSGSPIRDGTKAVLDADGAAANCIDVDDKDRWHWENIDFSNATADCVTASTADGQYHRFINCDFHDATGDGVGNSGGEFFYYTEFIRCRFYNNVNGVGNCRYSHYVGCSFYDNSNDGAYSEWCAFVDCLFHDNGRYNVLNIHNLIAHCTLDDATTAGVYSTIYVGTLWCNRITGTGTGILGDGSAEAAAYYNFINTSPATNNIDVSKQIDDDVDTNTTSGTEGYEDAANDKYNLRLGAAGYRTEIDLGGSNYVRAPMGLPTMIIPRIGSSL